MPHWSKVPQDPGGDSTFHCIWNILNSTLKKLQVSGHWWEMEAEENGFCGIASRFHFYPEEGWRNFVLSWKYFQSQSLICKLNFGIGQLRRKGQQ